MLLSTRKQTHEKGSLLDINLFSYLFLKYRVGLHSVELGLTVNMELDFTVNTELDFTVNTEFEFSVSIEMVRIMRTYTHCAAVVRQCDATGKTVLI